MADPFSREWVRRLYNSRNWDAMTAILLLLLPNVEEVEITSRENYLEQTGEVLRNASKLQSSRMGSQFSLPKLSAISIGSWNIEDDARLSIVDLVPILQMPSLRSFSCIGIIDLRRDSADLTLPIHVVNLTLDNCGMDTDYTKRLISRCVSLKHLHVNYSTLHDHISFSPAVLFQSFDHLQHQLESLTVLEKRAWVESGVDLEDVVPIPQMSGFTKLHTLEISSHFLFDRRILISGLGEKPAKSDNGEPEIEKSRLFKLADLPSSLAHLTVRHANAGVMASCLTQLQVNELPNLKDVHMKFSGPAQSTIDDDVWPVFARLFLKRGVMLSFNLSRHLTDEEMVI